MEPPVVLAIHGVANRQRDDFAVLVEAFAAGIGRDPADVRPVYWGDLAPQTTSMVSIPRADDRNDVPALPSLEAQPPRMPSEIASRATLVRDETLGKVAELASEAVPADTEVVVSQAISDASLRAPGAVIPAAADVLAAVVVSWPPTGSAGVQESLIGSLRDALGRALEAFGRSAGALVGDVLESLLRKGEAAVSITGARTLGDILQYEAAGERIRGCLDDEYVEATSSGREVDIVAHSLGSLVAAEWLLGASAVRPGGRDSSAPRDRRVRRLITFGAQVSLFAELHGLLTADGRTTEKPPVPFTGSVERWVNVWHQIDPLAFVMGRAIILAGHQASIEDRRLPLADLPDDLGEVTGTHSSYWEDRRFLTLVRNLLQAPDGPDS